MTLSKGYLSPIWVLTFALQVVVGSTNVTAQATYVPVGGGPGTIADPQAFFSVISPISCSDKSQTLPHKGFVKADTEVKIDALVSNTGHCDVYISKKYYSTIWRDIDYILWSNTPAGESTHNLSYSAGVRPDVDPQVYDTRSPGAGNPGTTRDTNSLGKWLFTFQGLQGSTNCKFETLSSLLTQELYVVKCRPLFGDRHLAPNATPIDIFISSDSSWDAAVSDLANAIADWNSKMPANAQFNGTVQRGTCNGEAGCVQVGEASIGDCGQAYGQTSGSEEIIANATVTLRDNWRTWTADSLRRTLKHELGHLRGLQNYDLATDPVSCQVADAAMQPAFDCGPSVTPMDDVTPSDAFPAASPYNGGVETHCGF